MSLHFRGARHAGPRWADGTDMTGSRALLLLVLAHDALGYQSPVASIRANQHLRSRKPVLVMKQLDLSRTLFGDPCKAPIRSVIKDQLSKKTIGLCQPDLIDPLLDEMFSLLEKSSASSGGLEKLLLRPGELQKQRDSLKRDLSKRLAANVDTPLGDALEEKLGGFAIDTVLDQALSNEFLRSPADRLASLERKLVDVKLEMGLISLAWFRLKAKWKLPAVKGAIAAMLVVGSGALYCAFAAPDAVRSATTLIVSQQGAKAMGFVNTLAKWLAVKTGGLA